MDKLFVYVDGGTRRGSGEAGIGIAVCDQDGNVLEEISRLVGRATPEVARYRALIEGCRHAAAHAPESLVLFANDQQLVNRVNGVFETREPHLRHLIETAHGLLSQFPQWRLNLADRDANRLAPRLVERAFRDRIQEQIIRERLELRLQSRIASLTVTDLERLLEVAEQLRGSD